MHMHCGKHWVRLALCAASVAGILALSAFAADDGMSADTDRSEKEGSVSLALHREPSLSSCIVAEEEAGAPLYIVGVRSGDWYAVQYGEDNWGYCAGVFLSPVPFRVGTVSRCTSADIRAEADGEAVDRLTVGERVLIPITQEVTGDYVRVIYDGCRVGYLHTAFLEVFEPPQETLPELTAHEEPIAEEETAPVTEPIQTAPQTPATDAATTSSPRKPVTKKPATSATEPPADPPVTTTAPAEMTKPPAQTQAPQADPEPSGYPEIRLSVPYYTQYDGRWADLPVGESGKTVRQIGCALTCLAMTESYRTGTAVTPDTVLRSYEFTPSGSIYWPSDYSKYTGGDPYLAVYRKLSAGIPVIWHGQKANGSSHWVVIYGFTGGDLTPSSFLVRDPGSGSRLTLAQYLAVYPEFIKFVSR